MAYLSMKPVDIKRQMKGPARICGMYSSLQCSACACRGGPSHAVHACQKERRTAADDAPAQGQVQYYATSTSTTSKPGLQQSE